MLIVFNVNCIHVVLTVNIQIYLGSCHKTAVPCALYSLAFCFKHATETKRDLNKPA